MKLLQKTKFNESMYERPDKKWKCGHSNLGRACQIGPSNKGKCRATFECDPIKKEDRWICMRSQFYGGHCESGPSPHGECCHKIIPCQPIKSDRAKRNETALWVIAVTIGLLLILFNFYDNKALLSPGQLSGVHSTINTCQTCHSNAQNSFTGILESIVITKGHNKDSKQCLNCHILDKEERFSHSMKQQDLINLSNKAYATKIRKNKILGLAHPSFSVNVDQLKCGNCHNEHQGKFSDILAISDNVCSTCHQNKVSSFSENHPGLNLNKKPVYINFPHKLHIVNYFNSEDAPQTCLSCHDLNTTKDKVNIKPFKQICANCHQAQITRANLSGSDILVMGLPGLDIQTLATKKVPIGQWPSNTKDKISPFMHLFLSQMPEYKAVMSVLSGIDLLNLKNASQQQLMTVADFVWMIKEFYYNINVGGIHKLIPDTPQMNKLINGLSPTLLTNVLYNWLPNLLPEVEEHKKGKTIFYSKIDNKQPDGKTAISLQNNTGSRGMGGWYQERFQLFYKPINHTDIFLRSWFDLSTQNSNKPLFENIFQIIANKNASGTCIKCHIVDNSIKNKPRIDWDSTDNKVNKRQLTKFNHNRHFSLISDKGCKTCHSLSKDEKNTPNDKNFKAIAINSCKQCHNKEEVTEKCLICHKYHIKKFDKIELRHPMKEHL